jgi:flagellar basal body-associated protein FliL
MSDTVGKQEPQGGGGGKAGLIGGAIGMLLILGGGVTVGLIGMPGSGAKESKPVVADPLLDPYAGKSAVMLAVPQMIVNLADVESKHVLQSTWSLELMAIDAAAAQAKFPDLLPRVQDQFIKLLSSYRSIELEGASNKDFLQTRIKDTLNAMIFAEGDVKVRAIYFTEFVVQ